MGKGPTASDGTAESNVNAAGVLGVGGLMELSVAGLQTRTDAGALAGGTAQVGDFFTNFDGLSRQNRVRYDTPVIAGFQRSEEHTSELQSLMRISYAVFCLKKKK